MYIPATFARKDSVALQDFMERNSFATLVTRHADGDVVAGHIPLLLDRTAGGLGCLFGHVARANRQWRDVEGDVLTIFSGPHVYVSPRWYESDEVVPTWNYVAVHAYGPLQVLENRDELIEILRRMLEVYEAGASEPWTLERSGPAIDRMLAAIIGFRIPIHRLEGKWKLSQNHSPERQARVIAALEAEGDEDARGIAMLMRKNLESK
jgi:transcriptional regulator